MAYEFVMSLLVRFGLNSLCRSSASDLEGSCLVSQVVSASPVFSDLAPVHFVLVKEEGRRASLPQTPERGWDPRVPSMVSPVSAAGCPGGCLVWVREWVVLVLTGDDGFPPNLDLWGGPHVLGSKSP